MLRIPVDDTLDLVLMEHRHASTFLTHVEENRAHLRRYIGWIDNVRTHQDALGWVQMNLDQFARGMSLNVGLFTRGAFAGVCGYHTIDWNNRRTEFGYWLGKEFQGKGLMVRAVRALTTHAFRSLQLHRLEIRAAMDNKRSRAIPERLGFKLEGTLRQAEWLHDHFVDHAVYGMLAPDWNG